MRFPFVAAAALLAVLGAAVPAQAQINLFSHVENPAYGAPLFAPGFVPFGTSAFGVQPAYVMHPQSVMLAPAGVQFANSSSVMWSSDVATLYAVAAMLDQEQAANAARIAQPRVASFDTSAVTTQARMASAEARIVRAEASLSLLTQLLPLIQRALPVLFPGIGDILPQDPSNAKLDQINAKLDRLLALHGQPGTTPGTPATPAPTGNLDLLDALIRILQQQLGGGTAAPVTGSGGGAVSGAEPSGPFGSAAATAAVATASDTPVSNESGSDNAQVVAMIQALKTYRAQMVAKQASGLDAVTTTASATSATLTSYQSAVDQVKQSIETAKDFDQAAASAMTQEEQRLQELRQRLEESRRQLSELKTRLP